MPHSSAIIWFQYFLSGGGVSFDHNMHDNSSTDYGDKQLCNWMHFVHFRVCRGACKFPKCNQHQPAITCSMDCVRPSKHVYLGLYSCPLPNQTGQVNTNHVFQLTSLISYTLTIHMQSKPFQYSLPSGLGYYLPSYIVTTYIPYLTYHKLWCIHT